MTLKSVKVGVSILFFRVMNRDNDQDRFANTGHSVLSLLFF